MKPSFSAPALAFIDTVGQAVLSGGVLDFSNAGFGGGGVPIPSVAAAFAVGPSGGDDTRAIQDALDAVAARPLDERGFRGAVVLRSGTFQVAGQLRLDASGVVLRGDHATLLATGHSRRTLIAVGGRNDPAPGQPRKTLADVPAGARTLVLESVDGLAVGARVLVRRPSTKEWISALGMTGFPGLGQFKDIRLDWTPGSRDIEWERTIIAVDPEKKTISLDAPLTTALEARYGGGTVQPLNWPGRIRNVGVEGLVCASETDPSNPLDEEHAWICVALGAVENAWVRQVSAHRFVCSAVWASPQARAITVEDCAYVEPVAEHAGWRRVSFYVGGQQVLVQRCRAEGGRHDFAAGHCAAGPNVFLDCSATEAEIDAGPFESWASGTLYDNVSVAGAGLSLANVGTGTQGAGWTAANSVVWNCTAAGTIRVEGPPGVDNVAVVDLTTPSLYRAQLRLRLGDQAVAALPRTALPRDPASLALAPKPQHVEPPAPRHPLSIEQGYFVIDGRVLLGGSMNSAIWRGQLVPAPDQGTGTSPTRWAPGRDGAHLTENLGRLADTMVVENAAFYWSAPGLWYDRRRDDHLIAPQEDPEVWGPFFETPWALSGQGRNSMGLSRYSLTKFNPWFFDRLRGFSSACLERGLVFGCQVYDNHNLQEAAAHWEDFPWRPMNCLEDTGFPEPPPRDGAEQNRIHIADQFYDPAHPLRRRLHELYIRHTLDALADSPNVIFTLGHEFAGPLSFQEFFLDTIAAWQKEHVRRVHIALQTSKAITDAILADPARAALVEIIDMRYWQYLPDGTLFAPDGKGNRAFRELRDEAFRGNAIPCGTPELVYRQVREYRDRYPDKAVICGHTGFGPIPVFIAGGAGAVDTEWNPRQDGEPRDDAAFYRFIGTQCGDVLPAMKPDDTLAENAWCLAADGRATLVYSGKGDAIRLTKPTTGGLWQATWFNPRNGATSFAAIAPGTDLIVKPTAESWLLLLKAERQPPCRIL